MDERRIDALTEAVEGLKQANQALSVECRRWRFGVGGVLIISLVAGAAGAGSSADQVPQKLEAQSFVLRDPAGRTRATLGFRADGTPGFALLDEASKVRLALDICANGAPGVNLYSAEGRLLAAVAVRPDGSPAFGMFDSKGQVRASLDLSHNETAPGLSLYDNDGAMRAAIAVRPDQTPGVGLFDPDGTPFVSLDADSAPRKPVAQAGANRPK
jgi:hypothetical protein